MFKLTDEPIFKLSEEIAIESYEVGLVGRELFSSIAKRSVELDAVNQVLNSGDVIDGAVFKSLLFFGYDTLGKTKGILHGIFG